MWILEQSTPMGVNNLVFLFFRNNRDETNNRSGRRKWCLRIPADGDVTAGHSPLLSFLTTVLSEGNSYINCINHMRRTVKLRPLSGTGPFHKSDIEDTFGQSERWSFKLGIRGVENKGRNYLSLASKLLVEQQWSGLQSNKLPGIFRAGSEDLCLAWKRGIIFLYPELTNSY